MPGHARQVGYALHALPEGSPVPWHRVVNARGAISLRALPNDGLEQRALLEGEGVTFNDTGEIALSRYQWKPRRLHLQLTTP
jgi:methylated-DNA-protein-cysteine methyltransferase-like protein